MSELSKEVNSWVLSYFPKASNITSVNRMKGSTSASLFQIDIMLPNHYRYEVVLRQYDQVEWVKEDPTAIQREAESLKVAENLAVSSPKFIGVDEHGEINGFPLLLMSMLPGKVELIPTCINTWLEKLAITLSQLHHNTIQDFPWKHHRYQNPDNIPIPAWSSQFNVWKKLINIVQCPEPIYKPIFIHRDFHPCNVLWEGGEVSGVVDWVKGCMGHAGIDLGHCRWNLAMLYGVEEADYFLHTYIKQNKGTFTYDVYWDVVALMDVLMDQPSVYPGWLEFGKTDITTGDILDRMDQYAYSLLKKS